MGSFEFYKQLTLYNFVFSTKLLAIALEGLTAKRYEGIIACVVAGVFVSNSAESHGYR